MIAIKKAKLIRKHLGSNTPEWIIKNCISLLKEYEEIEWCGVPEEKTNDAKKSNDHKACPICKGTNTQRPDNMPGLWCIDCQKLT